MTASDRWRTWFFVPGHPAPQGSKRHVGRGILVESSKAVGPWRETVKLAASGHMIGHHATITCDVPLRVSIEFVMPRPKGLRKTGPTPLHTKRPDTDKLARAVLDGLTNVCFADDSAVVTLLAKKRYAGVDEAPGAHIQIEEMINE